MSILETSMSRRRFVIAAALAAVVPCSAAELGYASQPRLVSWTGRALGGLSEIRLYHNDEAQAREVLDDAVIELQRLEDIFSLYRPHSALVRLNRDGGLDNPPLDLVRAIQEANTVSAATNGIFDITIQPLWALYAQMLADFGRPPSQEELAPVVSRVGWQRIDAGSNRIALGQAGMALTLNGMAQGYITDRVADLLSRRGYQHVLVDLGEMRAPGSRPDGSPWSVSVRDPAQISRDIKRLSLAQGGLATSEAYGTSFRPGRHDGHMIDPATGRPAVAVASVTVCAATATRADLLSTAIAVAGAERAGAILKAGGGSSAFLVDHQGRTRSI
jgi:FAD:protein FMN transferase